MDWLSTNNINHGLCFLCFGGQNKTAKEMVGRKHLTMVSTMLVPVVHSSVQLDTQKK